MLFDDDPELPSLFSYCNFCASTGGENALKRRMLAPHNSAQAIADTQRAITFILNHQDIFRLLPSGYLSGNVDDYLREAIPVIPHKNRVEFGAAAFSVWANDDRFYARITKGVGLTCRFVHGLRDLQRRCAQVTTDETSGELGPLIDEMTQLLQSFAELPEADEDRKYWATLRLDQTFRLHERSNLAQLITLAYELDALVSLAAATKTHDLMLPEVEDGPVHINATGLIHPFVANAVANPVNLTQQQRLLFLTGPNMAGKTTYLRAIATGLFLAHLGMGVPAKSFRFSPVDQLLTSISLNDDLHDGISYFRAEALRVKAVAESVAAGTRLIAIMDEPFKGTNVRDAFDASLAILQRLAVQPDCLFVVSSHLIELHDELGTELPVDYRFFEAEEHANRLRFDYTLHSGVSSQRLGMRVLTEEGIFELLDNSRTSDLR